MKPMNLIQLSFMAIALLGFSLSGCKKDNLNKGSSDNASVLQLSADEMAVNNAMDDATKDAEFVLSSGVTHLKSTNGWPCNATIDSTQKVNDTITFFITYKGSNCSGNRTRTGKVEIKKAFGTHWLLPGATVKYKFIDYIITQNKTGKSITINGTKTFTNVSGGFIWQLGSGKTSIIHRVSGAIQTKFDDGTIRSWNVARQITYTGTPNKLVMTIDGFGNAGSFANLVTWGTNRNDEQFYTQVTQSVVHNQSCGWDPVAGIKVHQIPAKSISAILTFGYDDNDTPVTGDLCPTKYRVDWQRNGNSGTRYILLP